MAKAELGQVTGMREAREGLAELERRIARGIGKRSLTNGPGKLFAKAISSRAKVSGRASDPTPGSLKAAPQVVSARANKKTGSVAVAVLVDDIAAVPKEFGLSHRHYPAEPFARPAVDANREAAAVALGEELKVEVGEAIAAAAAKGSKGN